ncbi:beta-Ala-His dipeptidase-like [Amia ocellicauda]|uniref:beta-Ala-His dipeptidase-like n=1 Tax=Amia ocellicauda TaxID=2972642 RepID=UPI00346452CB
MKEKEGNTTRIQKGCLKYLLLELPMEESDTTVSQSSLRRHLCQYKRLCPHGTRAGEERRPSKQAHISPGDTLTKINYLLFSSILLLTPKLHAFNLDDLTKHIDSHQEEYVEALREWVAVESDSSDALKRPEVEKMMEITAEKLRKMGGKVDLVDIGNQELPNGKIIPLLKVVTAQFGNDPKKRTVCVYGHVDVQPAKKEDGWATEPYNLTDINGNLYGRGASDGKAPVLAWIHAVEAYQALNIELPVNVKYIIEGMEESGSNGLDAMVSQRKDTLFSDIDYIIISDGGWLSRRPALTYGTRGNCYFFAEVWRQVA